MDISLVIPPSIFLLDERVFPSLGVLKVASVLEKEGYPVDVLDLSGIENYLDALAYYLDNNPLDVIGVTVTTPQLPAARKIISVIRKHQPKTKIILGGPHVTLVSSAYKLEKKKGIESRAHASYKILLELVDVLVSGDGEFAILEAIKSESKGLIDADEPKSGLFLNNQTFDESPFPARHLIDLESYKYQIEGFKSTSMIAQLGCPFHCGFCGGRNSKSLRYIRSRSIESIVYEIEQLHKTYGYTGFMLYDDELNVNKSMLDLMKALSDLQKALKTEFRFRGFIKSELFTEEMAVAMFQTGFRWILTGFESGSARILENINKRATREDNTRALEVSKKHNLKVKALMSLGHPGESDETIADTTNWLLETKPDDFDCTLITTYPGTPYYDEAVPHESMNGIYTYSAPKSGDRLHAVDIDFTVREDFYKGDPEGGYKSYVFTDHLSAEELVERRDEVERTVRKALNIPFNPQTSSVRFEHSMGMSGAPMSDLILRRSQVKAQAR